MITKLRLKNFRCFENHVVPFRRLSIVVGCNNAGKSTLIESLRLASFILKRYPYVLPSDPPKWLSTDNLDFGITPSMKSTDFDFETVFNRYSKPPAIVEATFDSGSSVTVYVGPENEIFATVQDKRRNTLPPNRRKELDILPRVRILPQIGPLSQAEKLLDQTYVKRMMLHSLASAHFRNQIYYFKEDFKAFRKLAESNWDGLSIEPLEATITETGQALTLLVREKDFTCEVGGMGHGLQMWLQTVWFLARSGGDDCVILDEPDVYMHADLQRKLIRMLRDRYKQTILATHSVEIMAEVSEHDVLVIDRTRGKSRFTRSQRAVQEAIEHMGGIHNVHLTRLWLTRKFLLLEGHDDIDLLRQFHSLLFPDASDSLAALPSVALGGWGGWAGARTFSNLLRKAGDQRVTVYCILDRDYHTEEEISERYQEASDNGIEMHVWRMKEIENYLLIPSTIRRAILQGVDDDALAPSEEEITDKLLKISEDLRNHVVDTWATQLQQRNRGWDLKRAMNAARDQLKGNWNTFEERMPIVPGKKMVSHLSVWSQDAFGVGLSSRRLVNSFLRREIDGELTRVLTAIERGKSFGNATLLS